MPKKKSDGDKEKVNLSEATTNADASEIAPKASPPLDERFVKIKEVAFMVGVCERTIRRWMEAGKFPAWTDRGDAGVWPISVVLNWMRSRPPRPFKMPGKPKK